MKYQFVDRNIKESAVADLPVLQKKDEPFSTLKPEVAKAYETQGIIEPLPPEPAKKAEDKKGDK